MKIRAIRLFLLSTVYVCMVCWWFWCCGGFGIFRINWTELKWNLLKGTFYTFQFFVMPFHVFSIFLFYNFVDNFEFNDTKKSKSLYHTRSRCGSVRISICLPHKLHHIHHNFSYFPVVLVWWTPKFHHNR